MIALDKNGFTMARELNEHGLLTFLLILNIVCRFCLIKALNILIKLG